MYRLIHYFDVWGNAKDGWEINNQCIEFEDLYINENVANKQILSYLKSIGFLNTDDLRKLYIESVSDGYEIYERKGMKPLCYLQSKEV